MSSTDLAYVGDAVYELLIRTTKVWPSKRTSDLQSQVVSIVRGTSLVSAWRSLFVSNQAVLHLDIAEFQATLLKSLKESFELNDKEHQILNRGRNSVSKSNRRDPAAYQDATALEALIGYLYITNTPRCSQLLGWIQNTIGDSNELS
jgi:ribonuclease-3 family protein